MSEKFSFIKINTLKTDLEKDTYLMQKKILGGCFFFNKNKSHTQKRNP